MFSTMDDEKRKYLRTPCTVTQIFPLHAQFLLNAMPDYASLLNLNFKIRLPLGEAKGPEIPCSMRALP